MVHSHHERFDGKGYPRGLKGEQIPLGSRLFTVIDSYHAMRSDRSYRKAMRDQPSCPPDATATEALLTLFMAEKAIVQVEDALSSNSPGIGSAMRRLLQVAQR